MAGVKLGLGPSLLEKERKIQELTLANDILEQKLLEREEKLSFFEDKTQTYSSEILDLRTRLDAFVVENGRLKDVIEDLEANNRDLHSQLSTTSQELRAS